jgi:hypothetical protein
VEVLNKNDTLPSRQTASIRLGIAGRRVNPMTIPVADRDRRNILSNRRNFCQWRTPNFFLDDDDPWKANTSLPFTA